MATKKSAGQTTMARIKNEAATEVGVQLKDGYNGDLTSKQAGSIGGQMVKKMTPIRTLSYIRVNRNAKGHEKLIQYEAYIII